MMTTKAPADNFAADRIINATTLRNRIDGMLNMAQEDRAVARIAGYGVERWDARVTTLVNVLRLIRELEETR